MTGLEKLPCPPFEEARLSVDFTADRPDDLNIFRRIGDAEAPTLDGDWLEIPPADPMNSLDVPLNPGLEAPHVLVQAAWRAGPGAVVLFVGAPPAAPYGFFVGGPSGLVIRSGPSMLASAPELLGDTQDGETHIIEFWVSNGLLRGLIDGEIVVQAEDTSLQPPYVVLLHTEGFSVSINALTICDRASG
jgi:hypothetical protein